MKEDPNQQNQKQDTGNKFTVKGKSNLYSSYKDELKKENKCE